MTLTGSYRVAISAFGSRLLDILNVILVTRKSPFSCCECDIWQGSAYCYRKYDIASDLDQVYASTALWSGRLSSQCCGQAIA